MGKLEDLYKVREMLHANGMEMSDEQKKTLAEEEEKFIRTELGYSKEMQTEYILVFITFCRSNG